MEKIFESLGIQIEESAKQNLQKFCAYLLENNKKFNLTAIRDEAGVYEKHFADSLTGLKFFKEGGKILEVGSGGGFPSVPLKIANPNLDFTLLEATGKKCAFLNGVKDLFNFDKFEVVNARAEEFANTTARESYDIVTARAVASLNVLCELCLPFLKVGGVALFYKQESKQEFSEGQMAIKLLGGKIDSVYEYFLPSAKEQTRNIIVIKKVATTPDKYPREYKKILKTPL